MRIILKQFFWAILKKFPLMIVLLFSLTTIVATTSISFFMHAIISNSNNKINNDGNSSDIIFDNVAQQSNINYSGEWLDEEPLKMITTINMNGVDLAKKEATILPVNLSDYTRLKGTLLPGLVTTNWKQTAANNENYKATDQEIGPNSLGTPFISPNALYLFLLNGVTGFHLSSAVAGEQNKVFFDPRSIIFSDDGNVVQDSRPIGFYQDFTFKTRLTSPQSLMQINESTPELFNPLSLTNSLKRYWFHNNSNFTSDFSSINLKWTQGFNENRTLLSYFEGLPNISKVGPDSIPKIGVPYIEQIQNGLTIELYLDENNLDPLTKLYLSSLQVHEKSKIIKKQILMTPFQVDGKSMEIPTVPADLLQFISNLERFINNFQTNESNALQQKVATFTENLVLESLSSLDWTQTQSIQIIQDTSTYLFTSREMNDINQVVLEGGRALFEDKETSDDLKILSEMNGDNSSFAAIYHFIKIIANQEMTIFDTNENKDGDPKYAGTDVIITKLERRLLKDIIKDIKEEFDNVDTKFNTLDPSIRDDMTPEQITTMIDNNKINAITSMPIWFEFSATIGKSLFVQTFTSSLNTKMTFNADRAFNTIAPTNSSISKLNFDNYGVTVSSSHFDAKKLKVVSEEMIAEMILNIKKELDVATALRNNFDFDVAGKNQVDLLGPEYTIIINGQSFFINGYGNAPDFKVPVIDLTKPLPNNNNEAIIYVNPSQFSVVNAGLRGNFKDKTINIKAFDGSLAASTLVVQMNDNWNDIFQPMGFDNPFDIYLNNNYWEFPNVSSFRWFYFDAISLVVFAFALTFSLVILFLVIYILLMVIKFIFESLALPIAIARANGIPRRKIILGLVIIIIGFSSIFVAMAFIISYFVTPVFFGFLSNFWFVPFSLPIFPWWGIFVAIGTTILVIGGILYLIILLFLNKPILLTLSGNDIVKTNKLARIVRSNKIKFSSLAKLRISMMSTKVGKISLISLLTGLSLGISTAFFSLSIKVIEAKDNNTNTKGYAFAFDYETPQYQTGLPKLLSYNQLGEISEERRINSILNPPIPGAPDPYYDLVYNNLGNYLPDPLLAKRRVTNPSEMVGPNSLPATTVLTTNSGKPGTYEDIILPSTTVLTTNSGKPRTYENIILPSSEVAAKFRNHDMKLMFNAVLSVDILDIDIGSIHEIQIGNLWDQVSDSFPTYIALKLKSTIQSYRQKVLDKYPWYSQFLIKKDPNGDINSLPATPLKINADMAFDKDANALRLTDKYLIALGVFLGDEDLNQENGFINFNYTANDEVIDEPYTYVLGTWTKKTNEAIKLVGIKNNSKYVNLESSSGSSLNQLISTNDNKVIINEGAAFANNLSIGDKIGVMVQNDYYKGVKEIVKSASVKPIAFMPKEVTLEIVGISTDSIGQTFWINQAYANSLINLDEADYVTDYNQEAIFPDDSTGGGGFNFVEREKFISIKDSLTGDILADIPFNGMFSRSPTPHITAVSIPMVSSTGIYSTFFTTISLANRVNNYEQWLELYSPPWNDATKKIYEQIDLSDGSQDEYIEFLKTSFTSPTVFVNQLTNIYDIMYTPLVIDLDGIAISDRIFYLISTIFEIAIITTFLSAIPLLIVTMIISTLSLADDFRKTTSIMRVLGINKRNIIGSIVLIYLPIIVSGILLGVLFSFILNIIFQTLLFNTLSVFLTRTINGLVYGLAIGLMIGLISISILITTIVLMREKLEKSIKF